MESMVHIGGKVDKETSENLAGFVERVFKSGRENVMDQSTIVKALELASKIFPPEQVKVANCNFTNKE